MSSHKGHKSTVVCPQKGCTYHSRKTVSMLSRSFRNENKIANSSTRCPIHRLELVNVGSSKKAVELLNKK